MNLRCPFPYHLLAMAQVNKSNVVVLVKTADDPDVELPYVVFDVNSFGQCSQGEYRKTLEEASLRFIERSFLRRVLRPPQQTQAA